MPEPRVSCTAAEAARQPWHVAWTRETYDAFRPYFRDARWLNYLGDDEQNDAVRATYGPNYDRLARIKRE